MHKCPLSIGGIAASTKVVRRRNPAAMEASPFDNVVHDDRRLHRLHLDRCARSSLRGACECRCALRCCNRCGAGKSDDALVAAVNEAIDRLLADGTVNRIYASYGMELSPPRGP